MSYTNGLDKPTDYFNTVLYTGTGSSQTPSNGWRPDLSVIKVRSLGTQGWVWSDRVRGDEKTLKSNGSDAEETRPNAFSGWTSDGITVVSEGRTNSSGETYANWNWLASGGTASSNTDGSITSSVSANTTAGFSIVSYTGTGSNATVGHSLNSSPEIILLKNRSTTTGWNVGSDYLSSWEKVLELQSTNAESTSANKFNSTAPTSSVFSVGTGSGSNGSGNNIIAYCFHSVKGYSKIGSYTGNGNADGTFVYTGFKPSWVMIKRTDSSNEWLMFDNKRSDLNVVNELLRANNSAAELTTDDYLDFTAQGFKIRRSAPDSNASGGTYIYMAFAENPFVTSTGIPTTAR